MKYFLILLTIIGLQATAQSPEDLVKAAVYLLFTGVKNSDTVMIKGIFADSAIFQTITSTKEGKWKIQYLIDTRRAQECK